MQKRIFIALLAPSIAFSNVHPIASIGFGLDHANVGQTQTLTLIPSYQNTYKSSSSTDNEAVGTLFLGIESAFLQKGLWQLGASYYQSSSFSSSGNVWQFADPTFNNLTYNYQIQSRRFLVETKILWTVKQLFHPYLMAGIGEAINKSYAYTEMPISSDDVPMQTPFSNRTYHSFSYTVGIGVDIDIASYLRLGAGYRFADLGQAGLGTIPQQASSNTLNNNPLRSNEFLVQLSYVG